MTETEEATQMAYSYGRLCLTCGAARMDGMFFGAWYCPRCMTYAKESPGLMLWIRDVIAVALREHGEDSHE